MVQIIEHSAETLVDFRGAGSQPPSARHCCCARRTAAHDCTNALDSIEGDSGGIVGSQGVVVIPYKLHGLTRGHEAMAGRRRPTTRCGTFYLDQVEDTVIPAPTRGVSVCALALSKGRTDQRPLGRTRSQACGRGCPSLFGKGARAPPKHRWSQPQSRLHCGCTVDTNGHPVPNWCPLGRCGLRRSHGSYPRGVMATQVPAASAGKIRRNIEPVGVPAGVRHRHHGSRWKHRCDGNIFSCCLVWTCPDLAHEPHPGVSLLLGRALRTVRCELRQCLPATRCGDPPPCGEARARETLRKFISRFTKVRGTIPCISDASIITTFRQGVHDEKMLEKLATHDVETVPTLFTLADKCARAAEGRAWHSAPQTGAAQSGGSGAVPQDGKKKKKKDHDYQKSRSTALVVAAMTGGQGDRNKRPRPQRGNSGSCPVHSNGRHNAEECREIIDLAKRISERCEQSSKDGSPPRRRPDKEKVDDGKVAAAERDLGYQSPEGDLKDVFARGSYSGGDN
jgi:hypothetical protein